MADSGSTHEVSVDWERPDTAVLLVDDDTTTLSINAGFLRSWEYKVATATSGHEALQTMRKFQGFFNLVILDLNMKGMNGLELQKHIKSEFHNIPVIVMCADRRKSVMGKSLEEGAAFCLVKPVKREDLRDLWQYAVVGKREKLRVVNNRLVSAVNDKDQEGGDSSSSSSSSPAPAAMNAAAATQDSATNKKPRKPYCRRNRGGVVDNEEIIFCGPKRSKICWTSPLHGRFLLALRHLGMDKAIPTKILEIMNVPGLTREHVASHLQKYRMFLKKIAEKGILEGLSERTLRSKFAMGLPTDLIRDFRRSANRFRLHENYYHHPYNTLGSWPYIPQNPPITRPLLLPSNQTGPVQPNQYGTNNHTYRNFPQSHYHNGRFMTSANALTANNGLMSNYASRGNNRNFNRSPTNHGTMMPYGICGLQRSPGSYNNYHGTQQNCNGNNHGMIMPYGSCGLQRGYNHFGTQLNYNNASLTAGTALSRVQNVGYNNHNRRSNGNNDIFGLSANTAIVPVVPSSFRAEPAGANVSAGILPSSPQQSINGTRNAGRGGNHNQHDTAASVNQEEAAEIDDDGLNEIFRMLDDMVLIDEGEKSPRSGGVRSSSVILSSFNFEDYIELLEQENVDRVSVQTNGRNINALPDKSSSSGTNENPNLGVRNEGSTTNLELLDIFMADKADSSAENSTHPPQEQDWDMDLIETLFDAVENPSKK